MIKNKRELLDKLYSIKAKLVAMEDEVVDVYKYIRKKYKDLYKKNDYYNSKLNPYHTDFGSIGGVHLSENIYHINNLINSFEQRMPKTNNVLNDIK